MSLPNACGLGDLILATEVALVVHVGYFSEQRDAGDGQLLSCLRDGRRVHLRQDFITLNFGLLLRDGSLAFAESDFMVFPNGPYGAVRTDLVGSIPKNPRPPQAVFPLLHRWMLNS